MCREYLSSWTRASLINAAAAFRLMNDNYVNKRINDYPDKKLSGSSERGRHGLLTFIMRAHVGCCYDD